MLISNRSYLALILMLSVIFAKSASAQEVSEVFLKNTDGEQYLIGELATNPAEQGTEFSFRLHKETFGDYFLSMRPFRCLENDSRMLCYLPYPYEKPKVFSDEEMRSLEYEFLFIQRSAAEYGIDPWNGVYYRLAMQDGKLQGSAHAVDLNVLASPPEGGVVFPLSHDDLHEVEAAQVWLPSLEIKAAVK